MNKYLLGCRLLSTRKLVAIVVVVVVVVVLGVDMFR